MTFVESMFRNSHLSYYVVLPEFATIFLTRIFDLFLHFEGRQNTKKGDGLPTTHGQVTWYRTISLTTPVSNFFVSRTEITTLKKELRGTVPTLA